MKLQYLFEVKLSDLVKSSKNLMKYEPHNKSEYGITIGNRSGNQAQPLKPRHQKYFNMSNTAAEIKDGPQGIRQTTRPQPSSLGHSQKDDAFELEQGSNKEFLKRMAARFKEELPSTNLPSYQSGSSGSKPSAH